MASKKISDQIKEIKKLLNALPKKKTNRQKLGVILMIRLYLETIEKPLKEERDKEAKLKAAQKIIKKALKQFITALDKIYEKHGEIGDTAVRNRMYDAIHYSFIQPKPKYALPAKFGMFSDEGDRLVCAAIQTFLKHPEVVLASKRLKRPEARLNAFQDYDVESVDGSLSGEYFGYATSDFKYKPKPAAGANPD